MMLARSARGTHYDKHPTSELRLPCKKRNHYAAQLISIMYCSITVNMQRRRISGFLNTLLEHEHRRYQQKIAIMKTSVSPGEPQQRHKSECSLQANECHNRVPGMKKDIAVLTQQVQL